MTNGKTLIESWVQEQPTGHLRWQNESLEQEWMVTLRFRYRNADLDGICTKHLWRPVQTISQPSHQLVT